MEAPGAAQLKKEPPESVIKPPSYLLRWFLQYYRLATIAVCLVILILGYVLLISPKLERVGTLEITKLTEANEQQRSLESKLQYLAALSQKRSQANEKDIKKIDAMLPSGPGVPELLASLESIARESKVTMEGIEMSLIEPVKAKSKTATKGAEPSLEDSLPPGVRALEASVSVAATPYNNLKIFLGNIEQSLRLMDAVALLYSPAAKAYTITVRTYYLP